MKTIDECNCPRCGNKTLTENPPESDALNDFGCSHCTYAWDWREGSEYPKPARATLREEAAAKKEEDDAAAAAVATLGAEEPAPAETPATVVDLPTPAEFREMKPKERQEKLPPAIATLTPQEYADLTPAERQSLAAIPADGQ